MLYQICVLNKATENSKATVKTTSIVEARDITQATAQAEQTNNRADFRVYPFCTPADGEGQMELARHTLRSVENWERRNNRAVLNPQKRNEWDREDYVMCACVTFSAVFKENPSADMHELKTRAFSAIRAEQEGKGRISEREYLPGWGGCNITPKKAKATYPALDRLMKKAIEGADLNEGQMDALNLAMDGYSTRDIASMRGLKNHKSVCGLLARAYLKILLQMVELDRDLRAFTEAGITAEDIDEVEAILRKRAKK